LTASANREAVRSRHAAFNNFGVDLGKSKVESHGFPVEDVFVKLRFNKPSVRVLIRFRCRIFLSVFKIFASTLLICSQDLIRSKLPARLHKAAPGAAHERPGARSREYPQGSPQDSISSSLVEQVVALKKQ
jgi:hypothetical protein